MFDVLGALGAALPFAGSAWQTWYTNRKADTRQNNEATFNANQYATRWRTTVADMKAAGLNPMLAYQQGVGSGASIGTAGAGGGAGTDPGTAAVHGYNATKINEAQTKNVEADTDKKIAEAENTRLNSEVQRVMPDYWANKIIEAGNSALQLDWQSQKIQKEISAIDSQIENVKQKTRESKSSEQLNRTLLDLNQYRRGLVAAQTALTQKQQTLADQEIAKGRPEVNAAGSWTGYLGAHGRQLFGAFGGMTSAGNAARLLVPAE